MGGCAASFPGRVIVHDGRVHRLGCAACPLVLFLCLVGASYRLGDLPPSVSLCVDRGMILA